MKQDSLSILFFILKGRLLKNGEAPIILRVTLNGQEDQMRVLRSVPMQLWNRAKGREKMKRRSGNSICNVPLLAPARKILEKYQNHPLCEMKGVCLPMYSNQKTNSYLKEIADFCGIEKHLTTHVARHSFGTSITLANNVSLQNVSKMMGHSSTRMTQHYARVLDSSIMKDMANVEKSLADVW